MNDPAWIAEVCDRYLSAVVSGDADAMLALWGPEPSVEDPVGSQPLRGR